MTGEPRRRPERPLDMRLLIAAAVAAAAIVAVAGLTLLSGSPGTATPPARDLPTGAPSAPSGRLTVPAPIDQVDVLIRESSPPLLTLRITAGLPSGCAQRHSHQVSRAGDTITVTVLNSLPTGDPVCTAIYGSYDLGVDLGSGFTAGTTYTVRVNEKVRTFKP